MTGLEAQGAILPLNRIVYLFTIIPSSVYWLHIYVYDNKREKTEQVEMDE